MLNNRYEDDDRKNDGEILAVVVLVCYCLILALGLMHAIVIRRDAETAFVTRTTAVSENQAPDTTAETAPVTGVSTKAPATVHATFGSPDGFVDRDGCIVYTDIVSGLEYLGATEVVADNPTITGSTDILSSAGKITGKLDDVKFEISSEIVLPSADDADYHLDTNVEFTSSTTKRQLCATREKKVTFRISDQDSSATSPLYQLYPTIMFQDEKRSIILTQKQISAIRYVMANGLPKTDLPEQFLGKHPKELPEASQVADPSIEDHLEIKIPR